MRILVGEPSIDDRMTLQRHLGVLGDCQTVETAETLRTIFKKAASTEEERFELVVVGNDLEKPNVEQLVEDLRKIEWEANVSHKDRSTLLVASTLVEWMGLSTKLGEACQGLISKPIKRELLYKTLANLGYQAARKESNFEKLDSTLRQYIEDGGEFFFISESFSIFKTLLAALRKLADPLPDCVHYFSSLKESKQPFTRQAKNKTPVLLFVDHVYQGRSISSFLTECRMILPALRVIIMAKETSDSNIAHMSDIEADSVLTIPASENNIIEKTANVISPPGKLMRLMQEARESLAQHDPKHTLALIDHILEIKPYSASALVLRGDTLQILGDRKGAAEAYEQAHLSSSLFLDPLKRLADIHQDENPSLSLAFLSTLDTISPQNAPRKVRIGTAKLQPEGIHAALPFYDQAMELSNRETGRMHDDIANEIAFNLQTDHPDVAERFIDTLLASKRGKFTKEDVVTFNRKGILQRRQGHWEEAITNYRKALTVAPNDDSLLYNLAMAYMQGGKDVQAFEIIDSILIENPDFPDTSPGVAFNIANLHSRIGKNAEALALLNASLRLFPEHKQSRALRQRLTGATSL